MSQPLALGILLLLLLGPVASRLVQRNIEAYFFILGVISVAFAGGFDARVAARAALEPIPISVTVVMAGSLFALWRERLDRAFERMRAKVPRRVLAALAVFAIAALSSLITAVIAALVLVETVAMLRLEPRARVDVTVAGCFAIGICSSLTPLGGPLSTLAAGALGLRFWGLFGLLGAYVLPATAACALLAGLLARGEPGPPPTAVAQVGETFRDALVQGTKIFGFVAGLVLIAEAFTPIVSRYVELLGDRGLFWANSISAVLDNATLVALELHRVEPDRARKAIIALVVSGGMLIPGNIPNIIAAGAMKISSAAWARLGVPLGLALMCIYFALLFLLG